MDTFIKLTPLTRVISYGTINDPQPKGFQQTLHMSGDERVSLLEELRYEISTVTGNDYSQRLRRIISYSQQTQR